MTEADATPQALSQRTVLLDARRVTKRFGGLVAVNDVCIRGGRSARRVDHGPTRRQDDVLHMLTGL